MEIRILGCYGGELNGQHSAGFLIEGNILLEAGAVTSALNEAEQLAITHIILSHAHLDHTKELTFLVDNFFIHDVRSIRLMGIPDVMEQMSRHLFNDQLWPDFTRIPKTGNPTLIIENLDEGKEHRADGLTVLPVRTNHTVPAAGFLIRKGSSVVLYSGDTGPTEELWRRAREVADLKAVLVECSFPDERRELALESGHLTPSLLAAELEKLGRPEVPIYITHMKPAFVDQIQAQLAGQRRFTGIPLVQGNTYSF
jgi:cAMP phosphodiesterase